MPDTMTLEGLIKTVENCCNGTHCSECPFEETGPNDERCLDNLLRKCLTVMKTVRDYEAHWVDAGLGWRCSRCGEFVSGKSRHCPNCGARMNRKEK